MHPGPTGPTGSSPGPGRACGQWEASPRWDWPLGVCVSRTSHPMTWAPHRSGFQILCLIK